MTTREPVAIGGAVLALAEALIALLVAFGALDDPAQIAAVQGLVIALIAAVSLAVRNRVTPVPPAERGL